MNIEKGRVQRRQIKGNVNCQIWIRLKIKMKRKIKKTKKQKK